MITKITNPPTQKELIDKINEIIDGSGSTITIDSSFDKNSTNPVQNKVITQAIENISLAKNPNLNLIGGNLNIDSGNVSGFSTTDYMQFPFVFNFNGYTWTLEMGFTTGSNVTTQQNILDSYYGIAFAINNGKFLMALSSNGSSWDIGSTSGAYSVQANTAYSTKIAWDGTKYTLSYALDETNYTTDITISSSAVHHSTQEYVGREPELFESGSQHPFTGTINLNNWSLIVNGLEVWLGMDDVGLGSRANIDLSNLTEAGLAKFQTPLVSGENIKTINGESILGNGNITIQSGGTVDQVYDPTSSNAQSGIAIAGANFLTSADLPTNYVTTDTVQDISGRKTFLGEKAIYFKQQATSNKLGFTLYNPSNTELAALEYRPNTISGASLLALNCPQTTGGYVGFRYWGTPAVNIVAPKVATAGNYFMATHITNGTLTVTANNQGTVDISSLLPDVSNYVTNSTLATTLADYVTNSALTTTLADYALTADIPTKTSELTNDSNFATVAQIPTNNNQLTNGAGYITNSALSGYATENFVTSQGYITGITSSDVTTALGFTPYNSTNPNGYITGSALNGYAKTTDLATVATSGSYNDLSNKPTIPTVNNATLTIQKNGTTVKTFTANASSNVTANITVPTKVSELTNDSGFLKNTATGTYALTLLGTACSVPNGINIGYGSSADREGVSIGTNATTNNLGVAIGYGTEASYSYSTALGTASKSTANGAIQIGYGTNSNAETLSIGFYNNTAIHYNWTLLDGTTGLIPDDRLSSNIARTANLSTVATSGSYNDLTNKPTIPAAQVNADWNVTNTSSMAYIKNKPTIPSAVTESTVSGWGFTKNSGTVTSVNNVSPVNGNVTLSIPSTDNLANKDLSNLSTTGQAVIDGKVSKSGDTMTGALDFKTSDIELGVIPTENTFSRALYIRDKNDAEIAQVYYRQGSDNTQRLTFKVISNNGTDATYAYIGYDQNGNTSCDFPNTTCCDGQWVAKYLSVFSGVTAIGNDDYSISSYLPNDGHAYEVLACMQMNDDGTTSGTDSAAAVGNVSKPIDNNCFRIMGNSDKGIWKPRFNGVLVFLGKQRKVYYQIKARALTQGLSLQFFGYRRIGTNS